MMIACHCEISANNYEKKIIPFPYYFQYLFCELVKQAEPNLYSQKKDKVLLFELVKSFCQCFPICY